jgi:transposase
LKDAVRAAKETMGQVIHKVKEVTVSQLLDLAQLVVTGYRVEQRGAQAILHLYCAHRDGVAICPRCREVRTAFHDGKERCGRPFTEKLAWLDCRRRQTRRFEQHIYRRCLSSSCKAMAQEMWLHEATVKAIFKRWAKRTTRRQGVSRVRVLGMDEIALKKRHQQYALVLSDLERRCVIAVLPERSKERLEQWFADLSAVERRAIRVVSIDMREPYRQAVRAELPQAQLVADRFHVMKQLNERLTQMRRSIQRQADEATRQALQGSRWLLVKNRDQLTLEEEDCLRAVFEASPELRTLYLLKEEFRLICEKALDRQQAERFLRAWLWKAEHTTDRFLGQFVKTLRNWWDEILNYFNDRVTNGFVEGINRAYGYRNFENFRLQILAQHGPPVALPH